MLQWYDFVRLGTAAATLTTMYILGLTYFNHHNEFTPRVLDYWWTLNMFLFATFFASVEQIALDRGPAKTIFILFVASLIALRATRNGDIQEMDKFSSDSLTRLQALLKSLRTYLSRKG